MFSLTTKNLVFSILLLSVSLLIYACGGSSSSTPTTTPTAGAESSATATKALISALNVGSFSSDISLSKPAFKASAESNLSDTAKIHQALADFKAPLKTHRQKPLQSPTDTCSTGTSTLTTDDNETPHDDTDDGFSVVNNNCTDDSTSGETVLTNGSFVLNSTSGGFQITLTDVLTRTTITASGDVDEEVLNGTMSYSGTISDCDGETFLNGSLDMNLTVSTKEDAKGDGTFETDHIFQTTNLAITISEAFNETTCARGATNLALTGTAGETDNIDGDDTYSATFTNFTVVSIPATRMIDGANVSGETLSLGGTIAITSACTNGTFTLSTAPESLPFTPDGSSCPVEGRFLVTSGDSAAAVISTSTGGIQIDEGNNGSIEATYLDCEEAEVCT